MNVVCFHNPNEQNGYLSNWYLSDFTVDGVDYTSMEQYMMYKKAEFFGDTEIGIKILNTNDVAEIKKLGRQVRNYNDSMWAGVRQIIVYLGLIEKFRQNPHLLKLLKDTGNALLAECAVQDRIWGIGLSMTDADRFNIYKWRGTNLLGYSLMLVRDSL